MNTLSKKRESYAVSGVIEALLLIALVAIVISTIQIVYIPQIMTQREADHMDQVSNQFSYLKSMIDIQTMTKSNAPIFSMFTLGSRELPYFVTAPATGDLRISTEEIGNIVVEGGPPLIDLTSIQFEAYNSYFVRQTYILEGGGLVVIQPNGTSVMRVDPSIPVNKFGSQVNMSFNVTTIVGSEGKTDMNGYGKCLVRTKYLDSEIRYIGSINEFETMVINTEYPNAWNESLNRTIGEYVIVRALPLDSPSYVEIKPKTGEQIYLILREVRIETQIGPGWVI